MTGSESGSEGGLADLPPSCKLVHRVLGECEPCTQKALVDETGLPSRTVRYALSRLKDAGLVSERPHLDDPRQKLYSLTDRSE